MREVVVGPVQKAVGIPVRFGEEIIGTADVESDGTATMKLHGDVSQSITDALGVGHPGGFSFGFIPSVPGDEALVEDRADPNNSISQMGEALSAVMYNIGSDPDRNKVQPVKDPNDLEIVWFCKTFENTWKCLVFDRAPGGKYYEVTRNDSMGETYLDAYTNVSMVTIPEDIFSAVETPQSRALRLVYEYVKDIQDKSDPEVNFDCYVVWFNFTLKNWKVLISTTLPDGMYYEVTFSNLRKTTYVDCYKKVENVRIPDEPR